MPKQVQQEQAGGKFVSTGDPVEDDRNWIGRVNNELTCTAAWNRYWGFLASNSENLKLEDTTKPYNIDEQIKNLQQEIQKIEVDPNKITINRTYGKGDALEKFQTDQYNKTRNKDLKPQDRKIPKTWKYQKDGNQNLILMIQSKICSKVIKRNEINVQIYNNYLQVHHYKCNYRNQYSVLLFSFIDIYYLSMKCHSIQVVYQISLLFIQVKKTSEFFLYYLNINNFYFGAYQQKVIAIKIQIQRTIIFMIQTFQETKQQKIYEKYFITQNILLKCLSCFY
ncbi:unnamed protein product [Paramecium sonneborni]|uniref:Uncharacterized protein n=1 Tax=Paramecium sonneborni TaxID=65129 RepID=A0A8S1RSZ4_9CILI|nr:unnamed protein product [Paramecium sonneborni]